MALSRKKWEKLKLDQLADNPGKWKTTWDQKIDSSQISQTSEESEENSGKDEDNIPEEELSRIVERQPSYPRDIRKLLFAVSLLGFSVMINLVVLTLNNDIVSRYQLPDLVLALIPPFEIGWKIVDVLASVCLGMMLFLLFLHRHRWIVFRRTAFLIGYLYFMRLLSLSFTQLPSVLINSAEICAAPVRNLTFSLIWTRIGKQLLYGAEQADGRAGLSCGDMFFSGHTITLSMSCFTINRYSPRSLWPLKWLIAFLCLFGMICLGLARTHYIIDIVASYWLATGLFSIYHGFCETPHSERERSAYRGLMLLFPVFLWLEENVPEGRLPNQLSWPFPWPTCLKNLIASFSEGYQESKAGRCSRSVSKYRINTNFH